MQQLHPFHIPEHTWHKLIPNEYVIPSILIELSHEAIQWLLDDNTNPDLSTFPQY